MYIKLYLFVLYLQEHSGRVFRLQFDEFQIVSSSHDDTILVFDFLNVPVPEAQSQHSPTRGYTYVTKWFPKTQRNHHYNGYLSQKLDKVFQYEHRGIVVTTKPLSWSGFPGFVYPHWSLVSPAFVKGTSTIIEARTVKFPFVKFLKSCFNLTCW